MALSAVKATLIQGSGASVVGSVSATGGNALIVGGAYYCGSATPGSWTVTRSGDTYTTDTEGVSLGTTDKHRTGIASAPNVANGAVNLTIAVTNGVSCSGWALEVSGPPTSGIRDATSPSCAAGGSTTATANSLTNATANAIFVNAVGSESSANPTTLTTPSGYTVTVGGVTMHELNGQAQQVSGLWYKIVSATGAETPATTVTSSQWTDAIAVYKDGGGGGGGPTPVFQYMLPLLGVG